MGVDFDANRHNRIHRLRRGPGYTRRVRPVPGELLREDRLTTTSSETQ